MLVIQIPLIAILTVLLMVAFPTNTNCKNKANSRFVDRRGIRE
jgi:hypothetical protein